MNSFIQDNESIIFFLWGVRGFMSNKIILYILQTEKNMYLLVIIIIILMINSLRVYELFFILMLILRQQVKNYRFIDIGKLDLT